MGFLYFVVAFIVVFGIGMYIRSLLKKGKNTTSGGSVVIKPQININTNSLQSQAAPAAFCSKCGAKLEAGSAFCGNCGNKVV